MSDEVTEPKSLPSSPTRAEKVSETCSSLVVKALQRGGMLPDLDPALTLPADMAKAFDVRP